MNQTWTKYLPAFIREKVEGRHYLQNIISNTGWQFADNILRMGVDLVIGIWVPGILGLQSSAFSVMPSPSPPSFRRSCRLGSTKLLFAILLVSRRAGMKSQQ